MKPRHACPLMAIGLASALLMAGPESHAQDRYQTWQAPGSASDTRSLDAFVKELNRLIGDAEKARAADPNFLNDLKALANRASNPWPVTLIRDDFSDGNFTADPAWRVLAGKYWIEQGWGLRNQLGTAAQANETSTGGAQSGRDAAIQLFGQILNQAITQNQEQQTRTTTAANTAPSGENAIHLPQRISNAFKIDLELSSWVASGRLEIAVYQGTAPRDQAPGYRLTYIPGGGLELHRVTNRGAGIIETTRLRAGLEDKAVHRLEWTRTAAGDMRVVIDGQEAMTGRDQGFRDPFQGLRLATAGGDFIIRSVQVLGTN